MAQLKNCPFCGAEADVFMTDSLVNVGCPECDIRTRFYKLDEVEAAEIAWNRRVSGTEDGWISVVEAAEILGVHRNRVLQLVNDGRIDGRKIGKTWTIDRASVEFRAANPPGPGRRW